MAVLNGSDTRIFQLLSLFHSNTSSFFTDYKKTAG